MVAGRERPSLRLTVSLEGLPATTWWLVRISPFASKMTPEPVAVPVPVWPVVGSVAVTPSATIVTTAGLTFLKMSATLAWPPAAGAGLPPVVGGRKCVGPFGRPTRPPRDGPGGGLAPVFGGGGGPTNPLRVGVPRVR